MVLEKSVSIIIPCYQCSEWIELTLNTCLREKKLLKEIIIVDDFSRDTSWHILEKYAMKYPGFIKIFKNQIKGGNNARNYGFSISSGDYIQWLDADDQIGGKKLSNQLKCFDSTIDIVYSDWILNTYENGNIVRQEFKKNKSHDDFIYQLLIDNWSTPHCYLMKREIAQKLYDMKAWNPDTSVLQDREYFTMAAIMGAKFKYTPGYFAIYNRWNKGSVSGKPSKQIKYLNLQKLLLRFEQTIEKEHWISSRKKEQYYRTIETQRILAAVEGYPMQLTRKLNLFTVNWQLMAGIRTTLKLVSKILFTKRNLHSSV